jgi:hypothetical protein
VGAIVGAVAGQGMALRPGQNGPGEYESPSIPHGQRPYGVKKVHATMYRVELIDRGMIRFGAAFGGLHLPTTYAFHFSLLAHGTARPL